MKIREQVRCGRLALIGVAMLAAIGSPPAAEATVSLGAWIQHSPDDIPGGAPFTTLTGDNNTVNAAIPFTVTIEGVGYTTVTISTNGWLEFGGNTQGTSHPANVCLPTNTHTNPFLAAYWDDLNPFGSIIRYGTVGTSPNRTFIVDYEVDLTSGSEGSDDLRFQVQVHETSNLINVRYRDQQSATNGISATIGFQGAGGASGNAQPITCNGKVMDDNRSDEGWSIDASRAGQVVLFALMESSPDDISGFTPLSGNDSTASVSLPFTVTLEGTAYTSAVISTNGWIEMGSNTQGTSDAANACLPTSKHTNPLIAYYWDDMQTQGTNIRYGTVGTSPNRTFIVDFVMDVVALGSADLVAGQVQFHETSNLINVKYRDGGNNDADGQAATVGFQGAGGASSAAYPLTCNGKIFDDDRPDEGWSVHARSLGAMSLHSVMEFSPNDLSGFTPLSGDNAVAGIALPFTVTIDGVNYTNATIGTNGILQFGTTTGANPTANTALPSASFTGPTLFWFWDDLAPEGSNIQYGTVGTSPNRTFIVDFQENRVGDSGSKVNGQVQVHERSNVINVKYRSTLSGNNNGQNATIGFQGAGGASAARYPLTFNGKILDDNLPNEGWSVSPLPICGNSQIETKEQCDDGAANGTAGSCCSSTCSFKTNGTSCTDDGNGCTNDQCNGNSATCMHPNNSAPCSDGLFCNGNDTCDSGSCSIHAGDPCLPLNTTDGNCAASCNEAGDACNAPDPNATACNDGLFCNGIDSCLGGTCDTHTGDPCPGADGDGNCSESCNEAGDNCLAADTDGSACADGLFCNGGDTCSGGSCSNHVGDPCLPLNTTDGNCSTSCNEGADACNAADPDGTTCADGLFCNGADTCSGGTCAGHAGDPCPGPNGDANCSESCDEAGDDCDAADPDGSLCNDSLFCNGTDTCSTGACSTHAGDPCSGPDGDTNCSESCDEGADNCLAADPDGTLCRADAGECDVEETCSGGACPADAFEPASTLCGSPGDTECDNPDSCDGSGTCQGNNESSGFSCGDPSDTDCTNPDTCDGSGDCALNDEPITTLCRAASAGQECDEAEFCDGAGSCPTDGVKPNGAPCRASAGICDIQEDCDGVGSDCPTDVFEPSSTSCRADAGDCDVEELCPGNGPLCPPDDFEPSGTTCGNPSDTDCTNPDTCDGSGTCQDNHELAGTTCTSDGETCTVDECDGGGLCSHPAGNLGAECRAASAGQECDEAEQCDGINPTCPADGVKAIGTLCRADAGECDVQEVCDGVGSDCPFDAFEPDGTTCGSSLDDACTNPDSCLDGSCDPNHEPSGTECRAASTGQLCDEAEDCDGAGNCPADAPKSAGIECRASGPGGCDQAEQCDGSSFDCPPDAVQPSGTVCRADTGVCDVQEICDGTSAVCPADAFESAGTTCTSDGETCTIDVCDGGNNCTHPAGNAGATCRADAGECDVAEICDGTNPTCPADVVTPNGTACTDDGFFCTGDETCQNGSCASAGDPCTSGSCDEPSDQCLMAGCEAAPLAGCRTALKSIFLVKDQTDNNKDKLIWKWIKGQASSQPDFANPQLTADYTLCIYSGPGENLIGEAVVPPSSSKWTPISTKGYKYKDPGRIEDGIQKIILKGGGADKSKALVKGKGVDLPDLPAASNSSLDIDLPVRVQLVNEDNGICFEGSYGASAIKKNEPGKFKAKAE